MSSIISRNFTAHNVLRPTVGDSKMSFTDLDHCGWIKCDGRLVNVADFNNLFEVIGYVFGGSGSQFKLPDMRGRVPGAAGAGLVLDDAGRTLSTRARGQYAGEEVHLLNRNEMPDHTHGSVTVSGNTDGSGFTGSSTTGITSNDNPPTSGLFTQSSGGNQSATGLDDSPGEMNLANAGDLVLTDPGHSHVIGKTGGGAVHNNMQPTLFLGNAFIYTGLYNYGARPLALGVDII